VSRAALGSLAITQEEEAIRSGWSVLPGLGLERVEGVGVDLARRVHPRRSSAGTTGLPLLGGAALGQAKRSEEIDGAANQ
jgi:hypothetical protein